MSGLPNEVKSPVGSISAKGVDDGYSLVARSEVAVWEKGGSEIPFLHIRDEKPANTNGGSSLAAQYQTRELNTVKLNTITGASLSLNKITLPVGDYDVFARTPGLQVARHRCRLYNVSDSSTELVGSNSLATTSNQNDSTIVGCFTISESKDFILEHYTEFAVAASGLGSRVDDGEVSVFSEIIIKKVG